MGPSPFFLPGPAFGLALLDPIEEDVPDMESERDMEPPDMHEQADSKAIAAAMEMILNMMCFHGAARIRRLRKGAG